MTPRSHGDGPDRARVRVLPPLIPAGVLTAGHLLQRVWPLAPGYQPSDLLVGLGWLITGAAAALLIWPAILFRRSGQDPNPFKPTPSLVERGPYRFTRNPMYLAMVLVCVGVGALGWNLWMVLMAPVCALMLQRFAIGPEERYLEEKFGDAYRDYRARVRRWL